MLCYGETLNGKTLTVLTRDSVYKLNLGERISSLPLSEIETAILQEFVMELRLDTRELFISDSSTIKFIDAEKVE